MIADRAFGSRGPGGLGRAEDKERPLFRAVYGMLENRIEIFSPLPISSLDRLSLQGRAAAAGCGKAPRSRKKPEPGTTFDLRRQLRPPFDVPDPAGPGIGSDAVARRTLRVELQDRPQPLVPVIDRVFIHLIFPWLDTWRSTRK